MQGRKQKESDRQGKREYIHPGCHRTIAFLALDHFLIQQDAGQGII